MRSSPASYDHAREDELWDAASRLWDAASRLCELGTAWRADEKLR
ncbi:MAG TPA: hypothetical protein VMG38_09205 [Trebonia sp.]|nr:hypothetical protein [Trebonia sp.]